MTSTDKPDIEALIEKAKLATPGPWENDGSAAYYKHKARVSSASMLICEVGNAAVERGDADAADAASANAAFIAAANPKTVIEMGEELLAVRRERDALIAALTPSLETKAAYMGEFSFRFPVFDENGRERVMTPNVPWTTIKEIMKAILAKSALEGASS